MNTNRLRFGIFILYFLVSFSNDNLQATESDWHIGFEFELPYIGIMNEDPYNGGVERANRTFQDEFYYDPRMQEDTVRGVQAELTKALHKYNLYRPHKALNNLTPMCYIQNCISETLSQSHIL